MIHQDETEVRKDLGFSLWGAAGTRTRKGRKVRWTFLVRARPGRAQDGGSAQQIRKVPDDSGSVRNVGVVPTLAEEQGLDFSRGLSCRYY